MIIITPARADGEAAPVLPVERALQMLLGMQSWHMTRVAIRRLSLSCRFVRLIKTIIPAAADVEVAPMLLVEGSSALRALQISGRTSTTQSSMLAAG